jgi:hypothetical protein
MNEILIALVVYLGALVGGLLLLTKEDRRVLFTRPVEPPVPQDGRASGDGADETQRHRGDGPGAVLSIASPAILSAHEMMQS